MSAEQRKGRGAPDLSLPGPSGVCDRFSAVSSCCLHRTHLDLIAASGSSPLWILSMKMDCSQLLQILFAIELETLSERRRDI
jgi:hypothetical protein